jgi:hypothetical protein
VITSWIRAKHGYPVTDDWGYTIAKEDPKSERQIETLSEENLRLKSQIDRLADRLAVVERIATDPAERITREIDQLR